MCVRGGELRKYWLYIKVEVYRAVGLNSLTPLYWNSYSPEENPDISALNLLMFCCFHCCSSHKGNVLKISWGKDHQPSFAQRWNPFSTDIRLALYQSHPMWKKGHSENKQLSVKDFMPELQKAVAKVKETEMPISNEPVYQGSYWGLGSLIHNQSELGFNKRRGGIDY